MPGVVLGCAFLTGPAGEASYSLNAKLKAETTERCLVRRRGRGHDRCKDSEANELTLNLSIKQTQNKTQSLWPSVSSSVKTAHQLEEFQGAVGSLGGSGAEI